ncbi:MAG: DUF924 domain-containing protein [Alphaproteobacteria bacterium]|nr:DUF924 domain-containing protein [Alphaproteobacteria bacterium]
MAMTPEDILSFWFMEVGSDRWFVDDPALDETLRSRFMEMCDAAKRGDFVKWEETPEGMISLLLLMDQFPRRIFRGTSRAYENDDLAVELARKAVIKHFDDRIDKNYKLFLYLPFMFSENMGNQRLALFYIRERTKEEPWIERAELSMAIIARFGRFPERNEALGRETTDEEKSYLEKSAGGPRF